MQYEEIIRRQQVLRRDLQRTTKFRQGSAVEALCHAYRTVQEDEGSPRILVVVAEFKQQATSLVKKFGSALAELEGAPVAFWNGNQDGEHWNWVRKSPRSILTFGQMVDLLPKPLFQGSARKVYNNDDEAWGNRASSVCHQLRQGKLENPPGHQKPVDYSKAWQIFATDQGWSYDLVRSVTSCESLQGQKETILKCCAKAMFGDFDMGLGYQAENQVQRAFIQHLETGMMVLMDPLRAADYDDQMKRWLKNQKGAQAQVEFRRSEARFFLPLSLVNNPGLEPNRLERRMAETRSALRSRAQEQCKVSEGTITVRAGGGSGTGGGWLRKKLCEQSVRVLIYSSQNRLEQALSHGILSKNVDFDTVQDFDELMRFEADLLVIQWVAASDDGYSSRELLQVLRQERPGLPVFIVGDEAARGAMKSAFKKGLACDVIVISEADTADFGQSWKLFRQQLREIRLDKCLRRLSIQQTVIGFPPYSMKITPAGDSVATLKTPQIRRSSGKAAYSVEPQAEERLDDMWGLEKPKKRLTRACNSMCNPSRVINRYSKPPSGFLLVGASGSGKTLLVRALAGELQLPILQTTAADLMKPSEHSENSRRGFEQPIMKDPFDVLFHAAREMAPSLVFIDEIHPLILDRGQYGIKLLSCMDGYEKSERHILVIGATNKERICDYSNAAFWRPGRFEEVLHMELPDHNARRGFFQQHYSHLFQGRKAKRNSDPLNELVARTATWSPARLQQLFRESSARASNRENGLECETLEDLRDACDYIKYSDGNPSDLIRPEDMMLTAWHEAGHALAYCKLFSERQIDYLTIEPRKNCLGFMSLIRDETRHCFTKLEIQHRIQVLMAGQAAELLAPHGQKNSSAVKNEGVASDLLAATHLARRAILHLGMDDEYGPVVYSFGMDAHEALSDMEHSRVKAWMVENGKEVSRLLRQNRGVLQKLAERLLSKEALHHNEIISIVGK